MKPSLRNAPSLGEDLVNKLSALTLDEQRVAIGVFLKSNSGSSLWDLMCALRGPDTPSERGDYTSDVNARLYKGRRERKYKTAEIIRQEAFFGVGEGGARRHSDDHITLPPSIKWDHFDKHQSRAAQVIGLGVEVEPDGVPLGEGRTKIVPPGPLFTDPNKEAIFQALGSDTKKQVLAYKTNAEFSIKGWKPILEGYYRYHHTQYPTGNCCNACKAVQLFCPQEVIDNAIKVWDSGGTL